MTELTLQAGETLRIRTGRRLLLVMRSESSFEVRIVKRGIGVRIARALYAGWLRMHRSGARVARRAVQARREQAAARMLAQLDARILKDIGMEPHQAARLPSASTSTVAANCSAPWPAGSGTDYSFNRCGLVVEGHELRTDRVRFQHP